MRTTMKASCVRCALLLGLLTGGRSLAQDIGDRPTVPSGAKAVTCIVLPADAQPAERHAAGELAGYVGQMTGRKLPLVTEGADRPGGRALLIGRTRANLQAHNVDDWPRDTIYIGYGTGDIAIIGQGTQGTLFAVYEFLRDQGCRWYLPVQAGEFIPKLKRLKLANKPRRHTPSFIERGWIPVTSPAWFWTRFYYPWAVRNGLNALADYPIGKYPPEFGHGTQSRLGHTLIALIPSFDHPRRAEVFAAHPEWYPLVSGRRVYEYKGHLVQACLSNPEVAPEAARHVVEYLRMNPLCWRYSVSPNDGWGWCECEPCLAMDAPGSTWKANHLLDAYPRRSRSGPGPMSDRYVTFINRVARIVAKECPGRFISFYAYGTTIAPPRRPNWTLEPNVIVEYAFGDGICLRHDFDDPDCQTNADFSNWLAGWASRGNPVVVYDYPPVGYAFNVPSGITRRYKQYVSHAKRLGTRGWLGEMQGSWAGSGPAYYLKARLMWDADADVDELIREFCRDMYGPAAHAMQEFYDTLDRRLQEVPEHAAWGSWVRQLNVATIDSLDRLLAKAEGLASTPATIKRVAMIRVAMNSLILSRMVAEPTKQEGPDPSGRYRRLCSDTLRLVEQIGESSPIVVTAPWLMKLRGSYCPPFEALKGEELLTLPIVWRFRTDPGDRGLKAGWHRQPDTRGEPWRDIRVDEYWTRQGVKHYGAAWYATRFVVPTGAKRRLWLLFAMLDGHSEVWVDGRSAGTIPGDPWDKPKSA